MRVLAGALLLSIVAAAVACSQAAEDDSDTAGADATEAAPALAPIKGRDYAKCWFDIAGDNATLSCTSTARGTDPVGATVEVIAASTGGSSFHANNVALDIEKGGTVVVGTFGRSSFHVILQLHAELTAAGRTMIGETSGVDFWTKPTITRPEDLSKTRPAVIGQPYDLWPVALIDTRGATSSFAFNAVEYRKPIAPYVAFLEDKMKDLVLAPSFSTHDAKGKLSYLVAPASGGISAHTSGATVTDIAIPGPGYYAMSSTDFRAATAAEIRVDFAPVTHGIDASAPDAAPPPKVDKDPTCGGDQQSACADRSCDDGNRFTISRNQCVACGAAGETYCYLDPHNYTSNAGSKCNAGTRYSASMDQCVPCGAAGQTYCYLDPHNYTSNAGSKCNAGTRYSASMDQCTPCGAAGQSYCYVDPNNYTSNAGTKCNAGLKPSVDGLCH